MPYMIWSGPVLVCSALAEPLGQPAHERLGLLGEAEPQQRVEREGRVADPGVAVVPVALAAELLRQARRRRGDDRARRAVREQLERERRPVHHLAPAPLVAGVREPPAPVRAPCARRARVGLCRLSAGGGAPVVGLLERERRALAGAERELCDDTDRSSLERRRGRERQRQAGGAEQRRRAPRARPRARRGRSRSAACTPSAGASRRGRRPRAGSGGDGGVGSRWIGMKSSTSTTPSGVRKRVIRTFVSGK